MASIKALPQELQKVAEKDLNEIPENIPKHLKEFKQWLAKQPHLNVRMNDQFLIQFLRRSKYNMEKAKYRIHLFFTLKTRFPEFSHVTNVYCAKFREAHAYGLGTPLPRPVKDSEARIYFMKFDGDIGKGLVDLDIYYKVMLAMHEIMIMEDPYACINGIIYLMDLKDITPGFAKKCPDEFLLKVAQFIEHSSPIYVKSSIFINTPKYFTGTLDTMKKVFSEKFMQRLYSYDENYEEVFKTVPKNYFPIEYGGENGSRKQLTKDYEKKWLEYADYFKENCNLGTNEQLRPGKPVDFNSLYGLGGSLYKLEL